MALIVSPFIMFIYLRRNPYPLVFRCLKESGLTAFFTRSSAANIPVNMSLCEKLGLDKDMYSVSIPLGATINMDGAAIEYTVYTLFAAHAFGVHFSVWQIIFMVVMCVVCSAGAAGVPGGGIVMCSICLATMGLPNEEVTAMVAGVYVLLDVASTTLNVTGDCCGMVCIANRLGILDKERFNA